MSERVFARQELCSAVRKRLDQGRELIHRKYDDGRFGNILLRGSVSNTQRDKANEYVQQNHSGRGQEKPER
jgi:hypothetical protein